MAKPRVFVSSTYYDLKYVRERLSHFLEGLGFEPVLFENDDIFFDFDKEIDDSCFDEIKYCHFMILIIGRNYGSAIHEDEDKKRRGEKYISITKREYETAVAYKVPISVFVDKSVDIEYELYKKNRENLSKYNPPLEFNQVENVGVFEFLNSLGSAFRKKFDRVEDIENFILNQVSGMVYEYLESKKNGEKTLLNEVNDLKIKIGTIKDLVDKMIKNIVPDKYDEIGKEIDKKLILEFENKFSTACFYNVSKSVDTETANNIAQYYYNKFNDKCNEINDSDITLEFMREFNIEVCRQSKEFLSQFGLEFCGINNLSDYFRYYYKYIYPMVVKGNCENEIKDSLKKCVKNQIRSAIKA